MKRILFGLALLVLVAVGTVASATSPAPRGACGPSCPECASGCCAAK